MITRIATVILMSVALLSAAMVFVHAAPTATSSKPTTNKLRFQKCGLQGKSKRCTVDRSAFNPKLLAGDIIDIDFGPGRRYTCRSNGRGGSSACDSGLFGKKEVGDMNVITRGKNSRGEAYIFGSTSVGGEICDFGPDATGNNTIVDCNLMSEYPPEADVMEGDNL
jgi:hypothetical protein